MSNASIQSEVAFTSNVSLHDKIELCLLDHLAKTGSSATFCPSEIARVLAGSHPDAWGPLMQPVRRIAVEMAKSGRLVIYRKGKPANPDDFKGVYRLGPSRLD